jgi:hypothetical protein
MTRTKIAELFLAEGAPDAKTLPRNLVVYYSDFYGTRNHGTTCTTNDMNIIL